MLGSLGALEMLDVRVDQRLSRQSNLMLRNRGACSQSKTLPSQTRVSATIVSRSCHKCRESVQTSSTDSHRLLEGPRHLSRRTGKLHRMHSQVHASSLLQWCGIPHVHLAFPLAYTRHRPLEYVASPGN